MFTYSMPSEPMTMLFAACWPRFVRPLTTVSGPPLGVSWPIFQCHRTTASLVAKYRYSPPNAIPVPPPTPNELTTSALPSPVVSRNTRTPPRAPDTATRTSPFSRTTMCRDGPIDSATISAQKPGCSVSPTLSGAQMTFLACCAGATMSAVRSRRNARAIGNSRWTWVAGIYSFRAHTRNRGGRRAVTQYPLVRFTGCNITVATPRRAQTRSRPRRRRPRAVHATNGRSDLQFRRAGIPRNRDLTLSGGSASQERFHRARGRRRDSHGVGRDVGIGQAGHLARLGHRRHPAGVTEARGRVSRAADRGRAGTRRRPQLRAGGQHHRGARGEEAHGARASAWD